LNPGDKLRWNFGRLSGRVKTTEEAEVPSGIDSSDNDDDNGAEL
jgi:hypothetical protein